MELFKNLNRLLIKYDRLWIILITILIFSCEDKKNSKNMVICATGFVQINIAKDSTVTGSWDITAVDGFSEEDIGPQIGKGELAGNIKDGQIRINMNPKIADYNIFLDGFYSDDGFGGSWSLSTFRGQYEGDDFSGSFEITSNNKYTAYIKE